MLLLLVTLLVFGRSGAAAGEDIEGSGEGQIGEDVLDVEDIVKATAAEFEYRACAAVTAAVNASTTRLEERLNGLESRLSEQSALLEKALTALLELSESLSHWRHGGLRTAAPVSRPDGTAEGPQPSGFPSPTVGRVLGEPCRRDADCSSLLTNTRCGDRGRCVCRPGLLRGPGETCRPAPWLDGECRLNRHCDVRTPHAVCSADRSCQCPPSRMTFFGECRPFPRLSQPCSADEDCGKATKNAVCSTRDRRCVCARGFWNFRNVKCRPGVRSGGACRYDRDCSTFQRSTACIAGICQIRRCDPFKFRDRFRLVGGDSSCSNGHVEFTHDFGKTWKFVCDSNWTKADATVLCSYMGFDSGEPRQGNPGNAKSIKQFSWTQDLECEGTESNLSNCAWKEGRSSCTVSEVAAVECFRSPPAAPPVEPPPAPVQNEHVLDA